MLPIMSEIPVVRLFRSLLPSGVAAAALLLGACVYVPPAPVAPVPPVAVSPFYGPVRYPTAAVLPYGATPVMYRGVSCYYHGGHYYRPYHAGGYYRWYP
jgi:hypothetical protein